MVLNMNDTAFFSVEQTRRMGRDRSADATTADFAAYLHNNPGAWRVWNEREANLKKHRNLLTEFGNTSSDWAQTLRSHVDRLAQQKK